MSNDSLPEQPELADPPDGSRKERYLQERNEAYATQGKNQEEYDRQLLTLSTALMAAMIAFLKDIVHLETSVFRPMLYLGFLSLGLVTILVMSSFQVSNWALSKVIEYYKRKYNGDETAVFPTREGRIIWTMNLASGGCFIAGVFLFVLFIVINLAHPTHIGETRDQQKQPEASSATNQSCPCIRCCPTEVGYRRPAEEASCQDHSFSYRLSEDYKIDETVTKGIKMQHKYSNPKPCDQPNPPTPAGPVPKPPIEKQ